MFLLPNHTLKFQKDVRLNTTHFFIAKIPNKKELPQIAINHSSDINTKDVASIYRKYTAEPYSFLVNDTTLPSNNRLRFGINIFNIECNSIVQYKIMTINDQIRDEKLQYDIDRKAAGISAKSSGNLHKYEYLTGEDILPSNQQQIIEQAKFTYSPLGKAFEKQIKAIEDRGKKPVDALKSIKSGSNNKSTITKEIYDKILEERMDKILETRNKIDFSNLIYDFKGETTSIDCAKFEGPVYIYDDMKDGKTTLQQVEKQKKDFKKELNEITSGNPKHKSNDQLHIMKNVKNLYNSRQKVIDLTNDYSKIRSEANSPCTSKSW